MNTLLFVWLLITTGPVMSTENPHDPLQERLQQALAAKGPDYRPRTHLLHPDGRPRYTNRLILEASPYLLQHAHNPVDWHPWAAETFTKARQLDRPIFLSIGYSTCHWCHVMEEESFDNEAVARLLNEHFIAIKVDREQRPEVDSLYMQAVTSMQGHGGWPLSAFLTPDGKPFHGGTYYPREAFMALLRQIADLWQNKRQAVLHQADQVAAHLQKLNRNRQLGGTVDARTSLKAIRQANVAWDELQGGFGEAPKFPHETLLQFLLNAGWARENEDDQRALQPVLHSLRQMSFGGMHDQIGGGWHRYSTDPAWLVPHFEKMLYNQAQLALALSDAVAIQGDGWLRHSLRRTLDYVLRDMQRSDGLFHSATDADSEGEEGRFFIWRYRELQTVLGEDFTLAGQIYDLQPQGNWEGYIVLALRDVPENLAEAAGLTLPQWLARKDRIDRRLLERRQKREAPATDRKIITGWNAMLLQALARAGARLGQPDWLDAAEQGLDRLWTLQYSPQEGLRRIHLQGQPVIAAVLDDHAAFIQALLEIHRYRPHPRWLERAVTLGQALSLFADPAGGYFMDRPSREGLPAVSRIKEGADGALPAGNASALLALADLYHATGEPEWKTLAEGILAAFAAEIRAQPMAHPGLLLGRQRLAGFDARPVALAAGGKVRLRLHRLGPAHGRLHFELPPGWHANAPDPGVDGLQGLAIQATDGRNLQIVWPPPISQSTGFSTEPLRLYSGEPILELHWPEVDATGFGLHVRLQVCSESICLPPEQRRLLMPAWLGEAAH